MKIKVHRPLLQGIQEALEQIFDQGYYADKVIEKSFKAHRKWGRRDRRVVSETVYEIVRNHLALQLIADRLNFKADPHLKLVFIWLEAFQDQFELPDHPLSGRKDEILKIRDSLKDWQKESIPLWLDQEMIRQRGKEEWVPLRKNLNEQAPVFLRSNLLKADADLVKASLESEEFQVEKLGGEALRLKARKNVFSSKAFKEGFFEVQDLHSQKVVDLLDPQPGECVIDACAGAGGKTLHISSRMKNKGKVIALDISEPKLSQLKKRARRAGVHNLEIKTIDSSKVIKRLKGRADRLLLDVPCTGLGVLRRNPDTKWKLTWERAKELEEIQRQILSEYVTMLKEGGVLVYSTCSLLPSENKLQIQNFLESHPHFRLEKEMELFPAPQHGDGFYMARLISVSR